MDGGTQPHKQTGLRVYRNCRYTRREKNVKRRGIGYYFLMAAAWTMLAVLFSSPSLRVDNSLPLLELVWLVAGFHWVLLAWMLVFRRRGGANTDSRDGETRDPDAP